MLGLWTRTFYLVFVCFLLFCFWFGLFCFVLFFGTVFLFQIADVRLVATSVGKQERRCSVILKRLLCRVEQWKRSECDCHPLQLVSNDIKVSLVFCVFSGEGERHTRESGRIWETTNRPGHIELNFYANFFCCCWLALGEKQKLETRVWS